MRDLKIKEKAAIHCSTKELAVAVCHILHALGYKWSSGKSYSDFDFFETHEEKTCYHPMHGLYNSIDYCKYEGYSVMPAEEFLRLHGCNITETSELVDFDLQKAIDGAELSTADGIPARIICSDLKRRYGRLAVALLPKEVEHVYTYGVDGVIESGAGDHLTLKIVERRTTITAPMFRRMTLSEIENELGCMIEIVSE